MVSQINGWLIHWFVRSPARTIIRGMASGTIQQRFLHAACLQKKIGAGQLHALLMVDARFIASHSMYDHG